MTSGRIVSFPIGGSIHSLVKCPTGLPPGEKDAKSDEDVFNIIMADVSGSMGSYWDKLVSAWTEHMEPNLNGPNSVVYTFGSEVDLARRHSASLKTEDFKCTMTNLTLALKTVMAEIHHCKKNYIRAFIITDGEHSSSIETESPEKFISQMIPPDGKTVEVYMIGVGSCFPVELSVNIRSHLHNGPTNIPYLFWPKVKDELREKMEIIAHEVTRGCNGLNLSIPGQLLPFSSETTIAFPGDWIYYPQSPEYMKELRIHLNDGHVFEIKESKITYDELTSEIFSQWNTLILQKHRTGRKVSMEVFDVMKEIFDFTKQELVTNQGRNPISISIRLNQKHLKLMDMEFATLLNNSKKLIEHDDKYSSGIRLAELVIKTTSVSKYEAKSMRLKGHDHIIDYDRDITEFKDIYSLVKPKIMEIPQPIPDDCCRVTGTSTINDLQDSEFESLLELTKFEFLKAFTVSGIPIYSEQKDSSIMNPWTYHIKTILTSPYEILSQVALEMGAEVSGQQGLQISSDNGILLKASDETTRFNAVIPVFPKDTVDILKPLLETKLFAMCNTFSILKSVHIIDYRCHIAALACVWLKTIHAYPKVNRPEFIMKRIQYIEETTKIYSDRKGLLNFTKCLQTTPRTALVTDNGEIKCESLTKPTFLLYIYRDSMQITSDQLANILPSLVCEFIGRCLSGRTTRSPFTDNFIVALRSEDKKMEWYESISAGLIESSLQTEESGLDKFYAPEYLTKYIDKNHTEIYDNVLENYIKLMDLNITNERLEKMKSSGNAGDVRWSQLKSWAYEMDINEEIIEHCFSGDMARAYTYHSIVNRSSKDRMSKDPLPASSVKDKLVKKIVEENSHRFQILVRSKINEEHKKRWLKAYDLTHTAYISPMSKSQVIEAAVKQGVDVNESTFNQVYKYGENVCLLRNACMHSKCPHYMIPHKDFNQHLAIERRREDFPHNLHNITSELYQTNAKKIIQELYTKGKSMNDHQKITLLSGQENTKSMYKCLPKLMKEYSALNI